MKDVSQVFQVIVRALYLVAQSITDVSYKERLKSEIFLFVEAYFRRDAVSFKERSSVLDFLLKTAVDLRLTAEENYIVLHRELELLTNRVVVDIGNENLVSGIPEFKILFPESSLPEANRKEGTGGHFGINLPVRIPKARFSSGVKTGDITERQRSILELLHEKGNAPLMDILIQFPEFNEKTIRNDLRLLCDKGYATHIGSGGRGSRYQFVREVSRLT